MWKVNVIESGRSSGQKDFNSKMFASYEEARTFQQKINEENNDEFAPDWNMLAYDPVYMTDQ
jgi:hypothetical protein